MANIGAFSDVVFSVSNYRVYTFDKYRRKSAHRYEEHKMLARENVLESLGNDTEEITLEIMMLKAAGVDPAAQVLKLRQLMQNAEPDYLILGANVINASKFVITDIDEQVISWDGYGQPVVSKVKVTFKAYGERGDEIVTRITGGASSGNRFWSNVLSIARAIFKF